MEKADEISQKEEVDREGAARREAGEREEQQRIIEEAQVLIPQVETDGKLRSLAK